jgi:hypothetical protein
MAMKDSARCLVFGMGLTFLMSVFSAHADEEHLLLDASNIPKQYILQLSGTVLNETFSDVQALLTISVPERYSNKPYLIIINGFPKQNSRNTFFWSSGYSDMIALANEITCDIKRNTGKTIPVINFYYMSPELLKHTGALELLGDEGKKYAEKQALPSIVYAQAGKLKLHVYSNAVSGTVWIKGYDRVEKSFVQYSARFTGKPSYNLKSKQEQKK